MLKENAKAALKNFYWPAFLVSLIFILLTGTGSGSSGGGSSDEFINEYYNNYSNSSDSSYDYGDYSSDDDYDFDFDYDYGDYDNDGYLDGITDTGDKTPLALNIFIAISAVGFIIAVQLKAKFTKKAGK